MRKLANVCLRCQFRLLVASRAHARRGISNSATAVVESEVNEWPPHDGHSTPSATPISREPLPGPSPSSSSTTTSSSTIPTQAPRRTRSARGSSSVAMFQSIVETQARAPTIPGTPGGGTASIELVKDVARIQTMLEREGATLAEAYAFFEKTVYPQVCKDSSGVPQIVKNQIAGILLNKLALEKPGDFDSASLPSVSRITEVMIELDVLRPSAWATLMIELVQHIYRQKLSPDDYSSILDYDNAMARRSDLLRDLLGAWKAFCEQSSLTTRGPATVKVPEVKKPGPKASRGGAKRDRHATLHKAFGALFPQYLLPTLLKPTFAAFATYKLFTDPVNRTRSIKEDAAPFLEMMRGVVFQTPPPRRADFESISKAFPDLHRLIWAPAQAKPEDKTFLSSASVFGKKSENWRAKIHRQLGEAIKARNLGAVQKTWLEFWGEEAIPDATRTVELANSAELFNYFILAYTMLRRPQLATEVWNNMERIGIKATIKTWQAMLHGCVKANNAPGIKIIWDKLIASGIKLDTGLWTARIDGFFSCGEAAAGLRALDEMAKIWAARDQPQYANIAVKPSIEPVNAAVAGLLRLRRSDEVSNVLAWAAKHGINPDIYTFNTLLRPLVRRGDMAGIDQIFETMRSVNIRADVVTFTVLLDGALNQISGLPADRQVAVVERIFAAMESSGVEANMRTYAKIIYLLLREGDRADAPVKAVLAHIWHRGLELTSHIYTMLAEHYFSRDPPDAAAVTALIEGRKLHENSGIDRVFWERVIKGYCAAGEVDKALEIFDRVFGSGTPITFSTLHELLRALVEIGDMDAAGRVVEMGRKIGKSDDDVEARGGGGHGEGKRYWRHRFWHLAYEHGLMGEQLVERFRLANQRVL
ncbi:hypothetical protein VTI74DRAFT_4353 [Chaetomium olivicolor]